MSAREVRVSRQIAATPETVWAVLTDLERAPTTLRDVTRVEVLAGDGYGVGTRWSETRRVMGREESQTMEVVQAVAPRSTVVASEFGGVRYDTRFTLEPRDGGTRLEVAFGAERPGSTTLRRLLDAALAPAGVLLTRRMLRRDLEDLARAAEAG